MSHRTLDYRRPQTGEPQPRSGWAQASCAQGLAAAGLLLCAMIGGSVKLPGASSGTVIIAAVTLGIVLSAGAVVTACLSIWADGRFQQLAAWGLLFGLACGLLHGIVALLFVRFNG